MSDTGTSSSAPAARGLLWRSRAAAPPLVFALLTLLIFGDVLFRPGLLPSSFQDDLPLQFLPWREFGFGQLRQGNLPLWNPYIFGGTPYLAGFQSALFYPPNWLHLVLPTPVAVNWVIALHVFLAGYFTYLWCRARGVCLGGATLGGVMFMFSGPYFFHVYPGHLPNLCVMVWAPLLLLTLDKLAETGALKWCLVGAATLAMAIFAGHPQYVYYTSLILLLYAGVRLALCHHPVALVGGVALMFIGGVLLSAVQLFTGMGAVAESARAGKISYDYASMFSFPVENLLTLMVPGFFGSAELHGGVTPGVTYFGRWVPWEASAFIGVTGTLLAVIGAAAARRRTLPLVLGFVFALLLALGDQLPLHRWLYDHLPGFGGFRGASKFIYLASLFLCVLAAEGFSHLIRIPPGASATSGEKRRSWWPAAGAFTLAVLLAVLSLTVSGSAKSGPTGFWSKALLDVATAHNEQYPGARYTDPAFIREAGGVASRSALWTAAAATLAGLLLLASLFRRPLLWGLVALTALEMVLFARSTRDTMTVEPFYPETWLDAVRQTPGDFRVVYAAQPNMLELLYVNQSMSLGIQTICGYDPLVLRRFAELIAASQGKSFDQVGRYRRIAGGPVGMFRMLRCRYVLFDKDGEALVSQIPDPLPVAQLVPRFVVKESRDETLRAVLDPTFDPLEKVVLESAPSPLPSRLAKGGPAHVVASSNDWVEIKARTDVDCLLLITNNFSKDWRATPVTRGPQQAYTIMPANHTLMAIPLTAGEHHLRIEYAPVAFRVGAWVTVVSLAVYAACLMAWLARGVGRKPVAGTHEAPHAAPTER